MASKKHQFIMGLIVRQMRELGCQITFFEGNHPTKNIDIIGLPPKILRHRPDILGISNIGQLFIGEAKTDTDLKSLRTIEQLSDYTSIKINDFACEVFFGIPNLAQKKFQKIVESLNLTNYPHLHVLYIPEDIIND